jgi:hypothetical protein
MFERIFRDIKPKDQSKNISINISNDISNVLINADENRLIQVVSNMVDNAEKHIEKEGYINIKTEMDENHVVLIIEDSGEGIETKDLPYIFEPFFQGKQDENTKKKGAGLGLAICDYIIKKHGGEIFVYSEKDKGTKWDELQCQWLVPWESGKIEAIAYSNGKEIARETIKTSGAPAKLVIEKPSEDLKPDDEDISILTVKQEDTDGNFYPYGENRIYANIYGNARMLSFESGNSADDETNFNAQNHNCFMGLNRMFIQSTGGNADSPVSVLVGSINGDKHLTLSNKVSIDVQEIALRGDTPKRNLRITYTTNNSSPRYDSPVYSDPFSIKMGQTVRAAIFEGEKCILTMKESFVKGEGLYLSKTP